LVPRPPISCSADFAITMPDFAPRGSHTAAMPCGGRQLLIAVHKLSKCYGRATAVACVALALRSGEIWGFVGANGAGKTTTLRMLAGILKPDGGSGQACRHAGSAAHQVRARPQPHGGARNRRRDPSCHPRPRRRDHRMRRPLAPMGLGTRLRTAILSACVAGFTSLPT